MNPLMAILAALGSGAGTGSGTSAGLADLDVVARGNRREDV